MVRKALTMQALRHAPVVYRRLRRAYYSAIGRDVGMRRLIKTVVRPDRACIDVGAYHGVFVDEFVRTGAQVVAYEPNAALAPILTRMFRGRATIIHAAVSRVSGSAKLRIPVDEAALATIEPANLLAACPALAEQVVRCVTLDSQDLPPVGFLKIDVEGHEMAVLEGAAGILRRDSPTILVEAEERHRPGAVSSVWEHLTQLGYRGHVLAEGQILPLGHPLDGLPPITANTRDFLFHPAERGLPA